jgi:hypothetical protein
MSHKANGSMVNTDYKLFTSENMLMEQHLKYYGGGIISQSLPLILKPIIGRKVIEFNYSLDKK